MFFLLDQFRQLFSAQRFAFDDKIIHQTIVEAFIFSLIASDQITATVADLIEDNPGIFQRSACFSIQI
ncbi:unknown [[Clostridium] leptum CAG:27]|uniref:Uncharacterized protein n=1 Tax=[Clostridium] leptum CAG:27 TaxID=1263068 RepID=R6NET2_9FIRM|nr:unknown [[Clostridium] leptum CAG:27]